MLVNNLEQMQRATREGYAIPAINTQGGNYDIIMAICRAAEEMRSPVILAHYVACGEYSGHDWFVQVAKWCADRVSVPVSIHLDHGNDFDICMQALKLGFTSVMYDCSTAPYEENLARVAEMVRICHGMGATVEGELGHVGDNEGAGKLENPSDYYTDPAVAADFVRKTGVDALAVAVGNAHGDYAFPPKLDFGRISDISRITGLPLVLHGGSGLSDQDFREAAERGICKVNIFTDLDKAGKAGIEQGLKAGANTVMNLIPYEIAAMKEVVRQKIGLFGA